MSRPWVSERRLRCHRPLPILVSSVLILGACGGADRGDDVRAVGFDDETEIDVGPEPPQGGDRTDRPETGAIRADGSAGTDPSAEDGGDGTGTATADGGTATGTGTGTEGSGGAADGGGRAPRTATGTGTGTDEAGEGPDLGDADADDGDPAADGGGAGRADLGLPETPVIDLRSGASIDLAAPLAAAGRNVLLWFWEPGSATSRLEAEVVQGLVDESGDAVEVAAIGIGGDADSAARFPDESGLTGITIVWDDTARTAEQYGVTSLPTAILVEPGGDVIGRWTTLSPEVLQLIRLLG